jgi:hypothetical protein
MWTSTALPAKRRSEDMVVPFFKPPKYIPFYSPFFVWFPSYFYHSGKEITSARSSIGAGGYFSFHRLE